jgi:acyl carrier protein
MAPAPLPLDGFAAELRARALHELPGDARGTVHLVDDLGLDSLDLVEVAVAVQELAGVPFEEFAVVPATLGDLYDAYLRLLAAG